MCFNVNGNREQVCTVGELNLGSQYRTPEGDTMLVLDKCDLTTPVGVTPVANLRTGRSSEVVHDTKLGRDRAGRLYASRFLNDPDCIAPETQETLAKQEGFDTY